MEIMTNKIDSANAEIKATISMGEVNANLEKIAKQLAKTANVQGFRKGKVPVAIVKKQYGVKLIEDAEAEALRKVLADGLTELNIDNDSLIGEPNISQFDKSDDKIEVTVKVAMRPTIELLNADSFVPDFAKPEVTLEDVDKRIKDLAEQQAQPVDLEVNRDVQDGDYALIDFEGFVDGLAFDGGKAEGFSLKIGSGQFIPGFEDQLVGAKIGEEFTINVTFPAEYGSNALAGKDAEFKVTVQKIQAKAEVELNDDLAKTMLPGEEDASLEKLQELVKTQMQNEILGKLYNDELKPALLSKLVSEIIFALPEFVVEQEIDMALNKKASEMSEEEIAELRENTDKLEELRATFREGAEESVRATFIIDALAQEKGIKIEEQEVMQTIYYEAMQTGQDPQKAYDQYKNAGYLPAIQMSMVEDRVLSSMLNAKLEA